MKEFYKTTKTITVNLKKMSLSLKTFEILIKETYTNYFPKKYVNENLLINEDLKEYFEGVNCPIYGDNFCWYDTDTVLKETIDSCESYSGEFFERIDEGKTGKADKMWLVLGHRDRYEYYYCCDKSSEYFGELFVLNDDHPWGDEIIYYTKKHSSIKEYFASEGRK